MFRLLSLGGIFHLLAAALSALAPILGSLRGFVVDKIMGKGIKGG